MAAFSPLLVLVAAALLASQLPFAACTGYGYSPPGYYYYGAHTGFLTRPDLILPPAPVMAPSQWSDPAQSGQWTGTATTPAVPETPTCEVYAKTYATGDSTGHISMILSDTSNVQIEAPYTLAFANPSISGVSQYNANNSPATVTLADGGVVTAIVTSVIPAQNSNTLEFDLSTSVPDASYNPAGAYMPMWVSLNGIACSIVTGF